MSAQHPGTVRLRSDGLEFTQVDGEVVVLDLETSQYYGVNDTGAALWSALRDGTTAEHLEELLRARGATPAAASTDAAAFLDTLRAQRLLVDDPTG